MAFIEEDIKTILTTLQSINGTLNSVVQTLVSLSNTKRVQTEKREEAVAKREPPKVPSEMHEKVHAVALQLATDARLLAIVKGDLKANGAKMIKDLPEEILPDLLEKYKELLVKKAKSSLEEEEL